MTQTPERFGLHWDGRAQAEREADRPASGALVACPEESLHPAATAHQLVAGDNLEVLRLLQPTLAGQVQLIYIDPPYNTGNDLIYLDDFRVGRRAWEARRSGPLADGAPTTARGATAPARAGGRLHDDWLSLLYPRLTLAHRLLRPEGFLFVSIDDHEVHHLRLLLDEIFGEEHFVASICRRRRRSQANLSRDLSVIHDHLLCYRRSAKGHLNRLPPERLCPADYTNPDGDARGPYKTMPCSNRGGAEYEVRTPTGQVHLDQWRFCRITFEQLLADGRIVFPRRGDGKPRYKLFWSEQARNGVIANSWWDDVGSNQDASRELKELFDGAVVFDNPKPLALLRRLLLLGTVPGRQDLVLDFFAGSGTTGEAVWRANRADGGDRRFVLVQWPEPVRRGPFPDLFTITRERLLRAARVLQGDGATRSVAEDLGFLVHRLSSPGEVEADPVPGSPRTPSA